MKKILVVFAVFAALIFIVSCGGGSSKPADGGESEKNAGELGGECYPNKSCNEGLICDEENNVCIEDPENPADDSDSEEPETDEDIVDTDPTEPTNPTTDPTPDEDADTSETEPDEDADSTPVSDDDIDTPEPNDEDTDSTPVSDEDSDIPEQNDEDSTDDLSDEEPDGDTAPNEDFTLDEEVTAVPDDQVNTPDADCVFGTFVEFCDGELRENGLGATFIVPRLLLLHAVEDVLKAFLTR